MDVKLIERDERREKMYGYLRPGDWFAFPYNPVIACLCVGVGYYREGTNKGYVSTKDVNVLGPIIRLELAGTEGQTLLLRRAE